ncbi:hypothetical protein MNVI_35500 [Mycobacterium noviomagense]|uniref:STAS/SEC14 domain-containing protein n=2 Tax=Mycobacterium noviomagense TaxID=459858 RepID=A0A7I7PI46_9MYCO|nr:hypothetical protein MNVI_35500 [Mycobacterium noviomagense]
MIDKQQYEPSKRDVPLTLKENSMIKLVPNMPEGVTGIRVSGRLLGDELRELQPAIEQLLKKGEIRIVEVIASDYEGFGHGGLAADLKLGFGTVLPHYSAFKRIAIVSDKQWVAHTMHALAWMLPGEVAVFGLDELERAKEWAAR